MDFLKKLDVSLIRVDFNFLRGDNFYFLKETILSFFWGNQKETPNTDMNI